MTMPPRLLLRLLLAVGALVLPWIGVFPLLAQEQPEYPTPEEVEDARNFPLFTSHETLDLTLHADFHALREDDRSDEDAVDRPARMEWVNPDGSTGTQEIQIKTRGNFRLAKRNCDFPPLRLNVKKSDAEGTLFEGQDKIKMVVPCKLGQDYWEQYVLSEYLIYRTWNLLTPLSFRSRLVQATFVDESGEDDTLTRYAFLLEDDSEMAERNEGIKMDWRGGQLNPALVDAKHAILVEFFQYMIGNTDWSGAEMHNMELFRDRAGRPYPVPFDFDFSGMVDARYAAPDHTLPIRSVRQRHFRGFCPAQLNRQPEEHQEVVDLFMEKKEAIYDLWRNQEGLDEGRREDSLDYLDEFYEILEDPDRIQRYMLDQCIRIGE